MKYTIANDFITVQIKKFGAEICSIQKKDENTEYIWQGNERYWKRHSPILFPIVGKLLNDQYIYNNTTYTMSQHGFARDMPFSLLYKKEDEIALCLKNTAETFKIYPFAFELIITYKLIKNSVNVQFKVINHTKEKMLFSIGAHPAFNWPLKNAIEKEYYLLEFEDTKSLERLPLTPTGISLEKELISLKNNQLYLSENLFNNDALVITNLKNRSILFKSTKDDQKIKVTFKDSPFVGIWSKPEGAPFLCIEPWWGVADTIGHNKNLEEKKGIITLKSNEIFDSSYSIDIE